MLGLTKGSYFSIISVIAAGLSLSITDPVNAQPVAPQIFQKDGIMLQYPSNWQNVTNPEIEKLGITSPDNLSIMSVDFDIARPIDQMIAYHVNLIKDNIPDAIFHSISYDARTGQYNIRYVFPNHEQIDQQITGQVYGRLVGDHPTMVRITYEGPQPSFNENFNDFDRTVTSLQLDPTLFPVFDVGD
jgi:hypothetical protein